MGLFIFRVIVRFSRSIIIPSRLFLPYEKTILILNDFWRDSFHYGNVSITNHSIMPATSDIISVQKLANVRSLLKNLRSSYQYTYVYDQAYKQGIHHRLNVHVFIYSMYPPWYKLR